MNLKFSIPKNNYKSEVISNRVIFHFYPNLHQILPASKVSPVSRNQYQDSYIHYVCTSEKLSLILVRRRKKRLITAKTLLLPQRGYLAPILKICDVFNSDKHSITFGSLRSGTALFFNTNVVN